MCELLVGLPAVTVLGVVSRDNEPLRVHVERVDAVAGCPVCGVVAREVISFVRGGLKDLSVSRTTSLARSSNWWTCPRSGDRLGWFGTSDDSAVPNPRVHTARGPNGTR